MILPTPVSTLFPYTTLFRSGRGDRPRAGGGRAGRGRQQPAGAALGRHPAGHARGHRLLAVPLRDQHSRLRSEEHTSELQSPCNLVCRLLLEKKKKKPYTNEL